MRNFIALLFIVAMPLMAFAAEPQSKPARTALDRYSAAKAKLDTEYQARLATITHQLTQELQGAIKAATRAGDLDEANAIKIVLDKVAGTTRTFQIEAAKDWQQTVSVTRGQTISIVATGTWCGNVNLRGDSTCGPEGLDHGGICYLEALTPGEKIQRIDAGRQFDADADGVLKLRMADSIRTDNDGAISVTIHVQ